MNRTRDSRKAILYFALLGASLLLLPTGCESGAGGSDGGPFASPDDAPGRKIQEVRVVSPPIEARLSGDPIRMEAEWKPGKLDLTGGPLKIDGKIEGGLELKKPDWRLDGTLTVREPEEGVAVRVDLKKPDWKLPVHWEGGPVQVAVNQPKEPFSVQLIGWPTREAPLMVQVASPPPVGGEPGGGGGGKNGCSCGSGLGVPPQWLIDLIKVLNVLPPSAPPNSDPCAELRKSLADTERRLKENEAAIQENVKPRPNEIDFRWLLIGVLAVGIIGGGIALGLNRELRKRGATESTTSNLSALFGGFAAAFFVPGVIFLTRPEALSDAGKDAYHQLGFLSVCLIAASIGVPFVILVQQMVMLRLTGRGSDRKSAGPEGQAATGVPVTPRPIWTSDPPPSLKLEAPASPSSSVSPPDHSLRA